MMEIEEVIDYVDKQFPSYNSKGQFVYKYGLRKVKRYKVTAPKGYLFRTNGEHTLIAKCKSTIVDIIKKGSSELAVCNCPKCQKLRMPVDKNVVPRFKHGGSVDRGRQLDFD